MYSEDSLKDQIINNVSRVLAQRGVSAVLTNRDFFVKGFQVNYFISLYQKDKYAERHPGCWFVVVDYSQHVYRNGQRHIQFELKTRRKKRQDGSFAYEAIADDLVKITDQLAAEQQRQQTVQAERQQAKLNQTIVERFHAQYPNLPENIKLDTTSIEHSPIKLSLKYDALTEFQAHTILAVLQEAGLLGQKDVS